MKNIGLLLRSLKLLTLIFFLTLGLLMYLPANEMFADTDTSNANKSDGATEQTDGTAGASQQTEQTETDGTAGASEPKFEHYEPLPIEPIHREANNGLLGSGLVAGVLITGGAFVVDKRKGY